MTHHCQQMLPCEACGLLSGSDGQATTVWPMVNIMQSAHQFAMDLAQINQTFTAIAQRNEKLVAIYHSHPTATAYPSERDILHANYPEVVYVIVSLTKQQPVLGCFRIAHGRVHPQPFHITAE